MKYIRTKDRIIKKEEKEQEYSGLHYFHSYDMNKSDYEYYEEDIIAQANTVKKLCDDFVVVYEDGARIVYGDLKWAKEKAKTSLELGDKSIIYGAIWTNKGLIYVAKMNEKGEVELL